MRFQHFLPLLVEHLQRNKSVFCYSTKVTNAEIGVHLFAFSSFIYKIRIYFLLKSRSCFACFYHLSHTIFHLNLYLWSVYHLYFITPRAIIFSCNGYGYKCIISLCERRKVKRKALFTVH